MSLFLCIYNIPWKKDCVRRRVIIVELVWWEGQVHLGLGSSRELKRTKVKENLEASFKLKKKKSADLCSQFMEFQVTHFCYLLRAVFAIFPSLSNPAIGPHGVLSVVDWKGGLPKVACLL